MLKICDIYPRLAWSESANMKRRTVKKKLDNIKGRIGALIKQVFLIIQASCVIETVMTSQTAQLAAKLTPVNLTRPHRHRHFRSRRIKFWFAVLWFSFLALYPVHRSLRSLPLCCFIMSASSSSVLVHCAVCAFLSASSSGGEVAGRNDMCLQPLPPLVHSRASLCAYDGTLHPIEDLRKLTLIWPMLPLSASSSFTSFHGIVNLPFTSLQYMPPR